MTVPAFLATFAVGAGCSAAIAALRRRPAGPATRLTLVPEGGFILKLPVTGAVGVFAITAQDAAGNPAPFENVSVGISDETLADVAWDGLVRVTPKGPLGTATLQVRVDGHIGAGESLIYATAPLEFVAGDAVFISLGDGVVEATS